MYWFDWHPFTNSILYIFVYAYCSLTALTCSDWVKPNGNDHSSLLHHSCTNVAREQECSTMVRRSTTDDILTRAGNQENIEKDKNKVGDYVKNVLFERLVFVWKSDDLERGGLLHADFLRNCRAVVADGTLVDADDHEAETYMNVLWDRLLSSRSYRLWLNQKRSSRYQAVQDKFMSECCIMITILCYDAFDYASEVGQSQRFAKLCTLSFVITNAGMCSECEKDGAILPSLESFILE